jgi:hypothetical protein
MNSLRQIVMYDNDVDVPADAVDGETLPVVRGSGPRDGELMGHATIVKKDGGLALDFQPEEKNWGKGDES